MKPDEYLDHLLERHADVLEQVPWSSEHDRWLELLFCLAHRYRLDAPQLTRRTVAVLNDLSLLAVDDLADPAYASSESGVLCHSVLTRYGFEPEAAAHIVDMWCRAATTVHRTVGRKLQHILRSAGDHLRDELSVVFANLPLPAEQMRLAIGHWVQNVTSLPITLTDPCLDAACSTHGFSVDELIAAADGLDLNLAGLDDLVDAEARRPIWVPAGSGGRERE